MTIRARMRGSLVARTTDGTTNDELPERVTATEINEQNAHYWSDAPGRLVASLDARRFQIKTMNGKHDIFDTSHAADGTGPDPAIQAAIAGETVREQEAADRRRINDASVSPTSKLAALQRLLNKHYGTR